MNVNMLKRCLHVGGSEGGREGGRERESEGGREGVDILIIMGP